MALWLRGPGGRTKRSGCQAPVPYLTVLETERDLLLTQKRTGSGSETGRDEHDIYRYTSAGIGRRADVRGAARGFDGCEVRLCGLCAFVRPRVPCVS